MPDFSIMENPAVFVKDGKIVEIVKRRTDQSFRTSSLDEYIDHGSGILTPGFINCHTHMELSFLKEKLDCSKGFKAWIQELIIRRENAEHHHIKSCAKKEFEDIHRKGTIAIGDISSTGIVKDLFLDSEMDGFIFYEEIGGAENFLHEDIDPKISFAAHAPHTTSPKLIKNIKAFTKRMNKPFSIHSGESSEEKRFISGENKGWEEFLLSRGIDSSLWPFPSRSSVSYLDSLGVLDDKTLLVHMLDYFYEDIEIIKQRGSSICFCPTSNMKLHGRYPDIKKLINSGINCCIGTDSLASSDSIDIFDEMKLLFSDFGLSPKTILQMATIHGAKALLIDLRYGVLKRGMDAKFVYIDIDDHVNILESIIFSSEKLREVV